MKKNIGTWFCGFALLAAAVVGGCNVTETIYLQDIEVHGAISQPPIHIADNVKRTLQVTPRISFARRTTITGQVDGHSMVSADGSFRVDTVFQSNGVRALQEPDGVNIFPYRGENLRWNLPGPTFGLDIDLALSDHAVLCLGATYASGQGEGLWGGNAGIGLLSGDGNVAIRLDGGIQWQTMSFVASSVVVSRTTSYFGGSSPAYVTFYRDRHRDTRFDFYAAFGLNTTFRHWFVNPFANIAISPQTVVNYTPSQTAMTGPFGTVTRTDARGESNANFLLVSGGVYFDIGPFARTLVGVRVMKGLGMDRSSQSEFIVPIAQVSFQW